MAYTNKLIFRYTTGKTLKVCRYNYTTGAYEDPATSGVQLSEIPGTGVYTADIEYSKIKIYEYDSGTATWSVISPFEDIWFGTDVALRHIDNINADLRHSCEEINYTPTTGTDWTNGVGSDVVPDNPHDALDDIATRLTLLAYSGDGSLLVYTPADNTDWDTVPSDVKSALDELADRVKALEGGTATTPTNIYNRHGKLGIIIGWDAQDVAGIEYKVRWLFKHATESIPTSGELKNEGRVLQNAQEILYEMVYGDLSVNPLDNVKLYYEVGAKGSADTDWSWSALQSVEVNFPEYTQTFTGILNGLSVCTTSGGSVSQMAVESIDSVEVFPNATESGGLATDNYIQSKSPHNRFVKRITIDCEDKPTGEVTMKYYSETTGVSGSFVVSSSTGWGDSGAISVQVDAGDLLKIWTTDSKDMGHYHLRVEYSY